MRKILTFIAIFIAIFVVLPVAALFLWPVPMDSAKWNAPVDKGYVGAFTPNDKLAELEHVSIGNVHGPEDAVAKDHFLFLSSAEGKIMRINTQSGEITEYADTGGRPLGLEFDANGTLIVANPEKGLLSVSEDGTVNLLTDHVNGERILFTDDLDIAPDGTIYFTDASTRYDSKGIDGHSGSFLDILEHRNSGRVLAYDPRDGTARVVMEGLSFPNGIAVSGDGKSVLVAETGEYKIRQIWVDGPRAGKSKILIENLPGHPDNINRGPEGTFLVGIVQPRSRFLDDLSTHSNLRKLALMLPQSFLPEPSKHGLVFQMTADGQVIKTWHDPAGSYEATSGAIVLGDHIYFTSVEESKIGRLKYSQ